MVYIDDPGAIDRDTVRNTRFESAPTGHVSDGTVVVMGLDQQPSAALIASHMLSARECFERDDFRGDAFRSPVGNPFHQSFVFETLRAESFTSLMSNGSSSFLQQQTFLRVEEVNATLSHFSGQSVVVKVRVVSTKAQTQPSFAVKISVASPEIASAPRQG